MKVYIIYYKKFKISYLYIFISFCIFNIISNCGGAGTSGVSGANVTFSSNVVFNDGSGIAKGTTSDQRKLIAFGPDILANIKESNSSAFNIPDIDVNSFPIIEVSNGYNIRYIEEENALIAEKIGSGKASIV